MKLASNIDTIMKYEEERWVDFPQNLGKETGGFATMPFGVHPYVLMSWTDNLSSMYTLIHELGHCGQFIFTEKNRSFLDSEPSLYLMETPSTFNELLFTNTLTMKAARILGCMDLSGRRGRLDGDEQHRGPVGVHRLGAADVVHPDRGRHRPVRLRRRPAGGDPPCARPRDRRGVGQQSTSTTANSQ